MYAAARNGQTEVVAYLVGRGAAIDARGVFGATALHWAAYNGHSETVEWLLAHGADPRLEDPRFTATVADWASEGGHQALASRLRSAPPGRTAER
jgi:ankyrin repeat protein